MPVLHQPVHRIGHHRCRPSPFVRQFRIEIGRRDMRLVRPPLAPKRHGRIARVPFRIQRPDPLLVLFRFQEYLHRNEALVGRIGLHQRTIQRCMLGDQLLLDGQRHGFIKELFEKPTLCKPPLPVL